MGCLSLVEGLAGADVGDGHMRLKIVGRITFVCLCLIMVLPCGSAIPQEIQWHSYSAGMSRGKFEKKKMFIHFYADWCAVCRQMQKNTFKDPAVVATLNQNFIPVKVDADREVETAMIYNVRALPDNWFIAEDGEILGRRPGYIAPEELKDILNMIVSETGQTN